MSFLLGFLGACIGIIFIVAIIILIIYHWIKKTIGKNNMNELINAAKQAKTLEEQEYSRIKNVSGMTKLLEPEIIRDFPDFNKELLYSRVEANLIKIFSAIEEQSADTIKQDEELKLVVSNVEDKIKDLRQNNKIESYRDIKFHNHAIKQYMKQAGIATITISSTLEYYYKDEKTEERFNKLKKQTRYTCKFIYIYDENKLGKTKVAFAMSCPNCGAPLKGIGDYNCEYCSSHIEPINLKVWKMSSYKEDYK